MIRTSLGASGIPIRRSKPTNGDKVFSAMSHIMLVTWTIIVVLPLMWTFVSSFKSTSEIFSSPFSWPRKPHWDNFSNAWSEAHIGDYFLNTIVVVFSALAIVMILGAMCSYVLARYRFRGNKIIYMLMLAGNTFPLFLAVVPLFFTLKNLELTNTVTGLVVTYVAFALPFTVFFLYAFLKTLPLEVYEAARIDGAGEWKIFFRVMLPMAKPGFASVAIFNFLGLWNQYLIPIAINSNEENYVLSQGLASFATKMGYEVDFGALFASVTLTVILVLVVYVIFQRQLQGSVSQGTMK